MKTYLSYVPLRIVSIFILSKGVYVGILDIMIFSFQINCDYAPNFDEVGGHIAFGPFVFSFVTLFDACHIL